MANFVSQLIFMWAVWFAIGAENFPKIIPSLALTVALEATTDQIDNLILPIFQYSLITFAQL